RVHGRGAARRAQVQGGHARGLEVAAQPQRSLGRVGQESPRGLRDPVPSARRLSRMRPTRRVVTGHDAAGRAVVLIDGNAPNAKLRKASGLTSTLLWVTDGSPADNSGNRDAGDREIGVAPPPRGSIFRVVDFPPEAEVGSVDNAAMLKE